MSTGGPVVVIEEGTLEFYPSVEAAEYASEVYDIGDEGLEYFLHDGTRLLASAEGGRFPELQSFKLRPMSPTESEPDRLRKLIVAFFEKWRVAPHADYHSLSTSELISIGLREFGG